MKRPAMKQNVNGWIYCRTVRDLRDCGKEAGVSGGELDELLRTPLPCLLHWLNNALDEPEFVEVFIQDAKDLLAYAKDARAGSRGV